MSLETIKEIVENSKAFFNAMQIVGSVENLFRDLVYLVDDLDRKLNAALEENKQLKKLIPKGNDDKST